MAFLRLTSADATAFKLFFALLLLYGIMSFLVYSVININFITPLPHDAPPDRFSEARAIDHVRVLAQQIGGRQEGSPGLRQAAVYIRTQLELIKKRAGSTVRVEVEETVVNGSFNMIFLRHSISLTYRNHTNVLMRISAIDSQETEPSFLLNAHFDSPPGSPGAGDCGSCVASLLELARVTVDSGWIPPRPVIFLFNGAEELFMLGSHGFMTTHRWRDTIGAFINVEASGTGGTDLVCQSGPGHLPSSIYAQAAVYPMANSAAQDVFGVIPGDTDYRIFSTDYGDIPGLDIIFLLGGYFYHTSSDTVERLLPGSMQARGDNLFSLMKRFANSSELLTAQERESLRSDGSEDESPVFFDYMSLFLVFYSRRQAIVFHSIPFVIFLFMPLMLRFKTQNLVYSFGSYYDIIKGLLYHAGGIILAIAFPIAFAILRLVFSMHSMNWFANKYLAFLMFVPCSLVGLLVPRILWKQFPPSQTHVFSPEVLLYLSQNFSVFELHGLPDQKVVLDAVLDNVVKINGMNYYILWKQAFHLFHTSQNKPNHILSKPINTKDGTFPIKQQADYAEMTWLLTNFDEFISPNVMFLTFVELIDEARFWGAFGFYSLFTLAYLISGLSGGFVTFLVSTFMLIAWIFFRLSIKLFGHHSLRSTACYVVPLVPCLMYLVYFGGFLAVFVIEKMGMTGSLPLPYGYFVPDVIVAAVIGVITGWCFGPLLPIAEKWLAKPSIVCSLLHWTVLALALSSQAFPYSRDAPKRVVLQHTVQTKDANQISNATFDFAVTDSNSLMFVFKHAPEAVKELHGDQELSFHTVNQSSVDKWKGIFPISALFSGSLKFPAKTEEILRQYRVFPHVLSTDQHQVASAGAPRRVNLELSLGSVKEVWVAVLNITGPLSNWSFANNTLAAPIESGGQPFYLCRLSGAGQENWRFWLEANSSEPLRVDVAVVDLHITESTEKLKSLFPDWMDVTAYTSYLSSYVY